MSITGIPELRGGYRQLGPARFWTWMAITLAVIAGFVGLTLWLKNAVGWPESYGFRCHGKGCWIDDLWHSPALLRNGGKYELGLFALIWSMPTFLFGCLIYALVKKRRRNPILSLDSSE